MTTIFYKKILGRYEISEITEPSDKEIRFEFEEPIDAKLLVSDAVLKVESGACLVEKARLSEGEISPKLYTGGGMEKAESFILTSGAVIRKPSDTDYARGLAITVDALLSRVGALETRLAELENKTERKITF